MQRIIPIVLFFTYFISSSQSYIGFGADNFNGIHGALFNPANIADSRIKIDINLASASVFTVNNYIEVDFWELFNNADSFNVALDTESVGVNRRTNGIVNLDILGPSALITLDKKRAIGFTTRVRSLANINTVDGEIIDFFDTGISEDTPIRKSNINSNITGNVFAEIGLTYAQVVKNDRVEFIKAGGSLKYFRGLISANAQLNDGAAFFNPADPNNVFLSGNGNYSLSENIANENGVVSSGEEVDSYFSEGASGLGIDLGFVYEYRPNPRANISRNNVRKQQVLRHVTSYKFKLAVSILDLGFVNYENQEIRNYNVTPLAKQDVIDIDSFNDFEALVPSTRSVEDLRLSLPTRLRSEFDVRLNNKFFLNSVASISLIGKKADTANRYASQITISPRYESKWFTAFLPITATQYGGVQVGLGGRLGPVFIGSSGLFSRTFDNQTRAFDIYAGVKVPIFHKSPQRKNSLDEKLRAEQLDCIEGTSDKKQKKPKRLKSYKGQFHKK